MSLIAKASRLFESVPVPDPFARAAIQMLVARTSRRLATLSRSDETAFVAEMSQRAVAENTDQANEQHYEMPASFFALVLGPRRKYSCCLYANPDASLAEAENLALSETAAHASLADGQRILELGCGWGSLSLYMAERYPAAHITAVSNSNSQHEYIQHAATARGLGNVTVVTADMNTFAPQGRFDRIVSVEMFEHMANWRVLLGRARSWLEADGRMFMHVFSHVRMPYRFASEDRDDWIAQHFFTGGIMPNHDLIRHFDDLFEVEQDWRWNGWHYQRTARHWLDNFDRRRDEIDPILREVYGDDAAVWGHRWRLFFLATAGLFGYRDGGEWAVSHYRLKPAP